MRVAITGAAGQLGSELVRAFGATGAEVVSLTRPEFALESPTLPPDVDLVVNSAAWTDVDACARDPERAIRLNGAAPGTLAAATEAAGARFVQISTNEVFDGEPGRAYVESDETNPINPYGVSKLAGELAVRDAHRTAIIVRTAWIFGGQSGFPIRIRAAADRAAAGGEPLRVVVDEVGNPTPAAQLAERIVFLILGVAHPPPIVHLAGQPPVSRHEWAARLLIDTGLPAPMQVTLREYARDSTPPAHAVLDTSLSQSLGLRAISWQDPPD